MKIVSSYRVKTLSRRRELMLTAIIFSKAVEYLLAVIRDEWGAIKDADSTERRRSVIEKLVHGTKNNVPRHDFDARFPKMPSYMRRAAIAHALGAYSAWLALHENWERSRQGKEPALRLKRHAMPVFYNENMSKCGGIFKDCESIIYIKLFDGHDWTWLDIRCRRQDVEYLFRHWRGVKASAPLLQKDGGKYYLRFSFEENISIPAVRPGDRRILAAHLGIHTDAACVVMRSDGTVEARKFINFAPEKDQRRHVIHRIEGLRLKYGPQAAASWVRKLAQLSRDHAIKLAGELARVAVEHDVDTIVFARVDLDGRKLLEPEIWLRKAAKKTIQAMTEHKANRHGVRVARVCPWGAASLAFDGSGPVDLAVSINGQEKAFGACRFANGKMYNSDLNASHNLGARFFLREITRLIPGMAQNLPPVPKRTLADLRGLKSLRATGGCRCPA